MSDSHLKDSSFFSAFRSLCLARLLRYAEPNSRENDNTYKIGAFRVQAIGLACAH